MVIWTRWGILGLVIPLFFSFIVQEALALSEPSAPPPVKRVVVADGADASENAADNEDVLKEIKLKHAKDASDRKAAARTRSNGFGIGSLLAAGVLWPLGRWMNRADTRTLLDPQTGHPVTLEFGGGHTLFFIPLEYWAFIWALIAVAQFVT